MESLREEAERVLYEAIEEYATYNGNAALDLFDDVLILEGLYVETQAPTALYKREELSKIAHYQAGKLRKDDREGFVRQIGNAAADLTRQAGNRTILMQGGYYSPEGAKGYFGNSRNPSRDYGYLLYHSGRGRVYDNYQIRYARIPQGIETCDFCLMLASRGFVYLTEESAEMGHVHRGCDCIVVPGVGHWEQGEANDSWIQDTYLEGYDTDAIYELWRTWTDITENYPNVRYGDDTYEDMEAEKLDAMEEIIGRREW